MNIELVSIKLPLISYSNVLCFLGLSHLLLNAFLLSVMFYDNILVSFKFF